MSRLVVLAGLPGSGKSAVARGVAAAIGARWVRIDSIEATIVTHLVSFENDPIGYLVATQVAEDQLRIGGDVVVDAVNGVQRARDGWTDLADRTGAALRFVHVTCTDEEVHRRRVEQRAPDVPGQGSPTWEQVRRRTFVPWQEDHLVVDNSGALDDTVAQVLADLGVSR